MLPSNDAITMYDQNFLLSFYEWSQDIPPIDPHVDIAQLACYLLRLSLRLALDMTNERTTPETLIGGKCLLDRLWLPAMIMLSGETSCMCWVIRYST